MILKNLRYRKLRLSQKFEENLKNLKFSFIFVSLARHAIKSYI